MNWTTSFSGEIMAKMSTLPASFPNSSFTSASKHFRRWGYRHKNTHEGQGTRGAIIELKGCSPSSAHHHLGFDVHTGRHAHLHRLGVTGLGKDLQQLLVGEEVEARERDALRLQVVLRQTPHKGGARQTQRVKVTWLPRGRLTGQAAGRDTHTYLKGLLDLVQHLVVPLKSFLHALHSASDKAVGVACHSRGWGGGKAKG